MHRKEIDRDSHEEGSGYDLKPMHPQVLVVDDDPMNIIVMKAMLS